jgi:tetratricopeptide (TPR) repeat protein
MQRLVEKQSYLIAVDYLRAYDFLMSDYSVVEALGHGLMAQGLFTSADYVFSLCEQSDTIKVSRAMMIDDYEEREKIFKSMQGTTRDLYLIENYLLVGDTVSAFLVFRDLADRDLSDGSLYRYAKMVMLFDHDNIPWYTQELRRAQGFERKAELLQAAAGFGSGIKIMPEDEEEIGLYLQVIDVDTVSKELPEDLALDSLILEAADTLMLLGQLRWQYQNNFSLDSMYCQLLLRRGSYEEASKVISSYLKYHNTHRYVRKIRGFQYYTDRDFRSAANYIILSNYRGPISLYVLAECLRALDHGAADLYRRVMDQTTDSTLHHKALRGYLLERYKTESYEDICSVDFDDLEGDTGLIRIYVRSLARCGQGGLADSLHNSFFDAPDLEVINLHGEYLISEKKYDAATVFYDSIIQHVSGDFHDGIYYNWALVSFLSNEMDVAQQRFVYYVANFRGGVHIHDALFKIATLNYLQESYDSAAYYYGLASEDDELKLDALRNELISYKKAGSWSMVNETGWKLLALVDKEEEAGVRFDIGYALLRGGRIKESIDNILIASRLESDPRYYYWLGEAYLSKGDFARALYSYQKVLDSHPDDEMWAPTAEYKTGIVLELLDEITSARDVYKRIIKERGVEHPIGAEAKIRLKQIEE